MTLPEAFEHFIASAAYKDVAKQNTPQGTKYRVYAMRYKNGELKAGAITELLLANGYSIRANKVRKIK
jgi:hypothetical protein